MSRCICDFEPGCGGSGVVNCMGCGGDLCVCAPCYGHGQQECGGCSDPACPETEPDWDGEVIDDA